jgi:hypothetical protein
MDKKLIFILILFVFIPQTHAATPFGFTRSFMYYPNGIDDVTGTVKDIGRNSIKIFDELNKINRSFIYLSDRGEFKAGDRVRVYYYPANGVVKNIRKEPLEAYQKNGRNLGYIVNK